MNLNLPYLYYYLIFSCGLLALALLFIPRSQIQRLFWMGMLCGSGVDFGFEYIYSLLNLTRYQHIEPFNIGMLSIWTVLAWTPTVMLFIYFLPKRKEPYIQWLYLIIWTVATSFVGILLSQLGLMVFVKAGPWLWLIVGFIFYYLIAKFYRYLEDKRDNL
ncbi:MAG: hypothetical protein APF81_01635 [Desulfosporosinus sp. BRH_c37]|nr:MAG: hypothetical protein APF81_01635 [Desulfosporosinus sp. BRH_c37]